MSLGMDSIDSAIGPISQYYSDAVNSMTESMERLASGKKVQKASDDLAVYSSLSEYRSDKSNYTTVKDNFAKMEANMQSSLDAANLVMDDLQEAKELYAAGSSDEADEIISGISEHLNATGADGVELIQGNWGTVDTVAGNTMDFDLSGEDLEGGDAVALGSESSEAEVDDSITQLESYIQTVNGLLYQAGSQKKMAGVAEENASALISAINSVDEAEEQANITAMEVRQDAAVAMLAQANVSRKNIASLYS